MTAACFALQLFMVFAGADSDAGNPVDDFASSALAEWILQGETLPAEPATLAALLADMPAAVRYAKTVTKLDYRLTPLDTGVFELTTPRGLVAKFRPTQLSLDRQEGMLEAVGEGTFHRPTGALNGRYALRFKYQKSDGKPLRGDFYVYINVSNPFLRFLGLFVRGLLNTKLEEEMRRMLAEAKQVMDSAERSAYGK